MQEKYTKMSTIRGTRYAIKLTKEVKGIPGFAPEYRTYNVCDIVFKFPYEDSEPYVQFFESSPTLDVKDIEQITDLLKSEFEESKYEYEQN